MPKLPRIKASEAEKLLFNAGFTLIRSKGSHRIYFNGTTRVVIPVHGGKILHPKIIKQVFQAIELTEDPQKSIKKEEKSDRPRSDTLSPLTEDAYKQVKEDRDASNEEIDDDESNKKPKNK